MGVVTVIKFECDRCRQRIEATGEMLGTSIDCPNCALRLRVPRMDDGASRARPAPASAMLSTQRLAAAGVACLVVGLALVARRTLLPLAGVFLLGTLVAGAGIWRRNMGVLGGALAAAAVLAPLFFLVPVDRSVDLPPAVPAVSWTEGTGAQPRTERDSVVPDSKSPDPTPLPARVATGHVPEIQSEAVAAAPLGPGLVPERAVAPELEPTLEQEPEPELSPVFSDDPFRDVFGPSPDEVPPEDDDEGVAVAGSYPEPETGAGVPAEDDAELLDSDRIARALLDAPDNVDLLEQLRVEIGAIANEDKKVRLMVAYALGCLYVGKQQEAAQVQGYIDRHYPRHPLATHVAQDAIMTACAACAGTGRTPQACPECEGAGECQRCAGSGQRELPGMDGATRRVGCVTCRGTGHCRRCQGTGHVSIACEGCRGSGKVLARTTIRSAYLALLEGREH